MEQNEVTLQLQNGVRRHGKQCECKHNNNCTKITKSWKVRGESRHKKQHDCERGGYLWKEHTSKRSGKLIVEGEAINMKAQANNKKAQEINRKAQANNKKAQAHNKNLGAL